MCNCNRSKNRNSSNCGCVDTQEVFYVCNECQPESCSDCPVRDLSTNCVLYTGEDLSCGGTKVILKNTNLSTTLKNIIDFFCQKLSEIAGNFRIINIGTGAKVYKSDNLLGEKQLRTITSTDSSVTVTEATNTIDLSVAIPDQVCIVSSDDSLSVGTDEEGCIDIKVDIQNIGGGVEVYKGQSAGTHEFRTLKSNSLYITENVDNTVSIELDNNQSDNIIYVNNSYTPTYKDFLNPANGGKGEGTKSKPFTNTHTYNGSGVLVSVTPDTAISNMFTYFVGSGSRLNPQFATKTIKIENSGNVYNYSGDFNYNFSKIIIDAYVKNTTTGYTINMDNVSYFDTINTLLIIEINGVLELTQSLGFRNSGNTVTSPSPYTTGKTLQILGDGRLYDTYNGANVLTQYLFNSDGNHNDSGAHFDIRCKVQALYQGVYYIKNEARIDFYNQVTSGQYLGTVNYNLKAFHAEDGQIRFFENASISISSETGSREYGITFEPSGTVGSFSSFTGQGTRIQGTADSLFAKLNNNYTAINVFNSISNYGAQFDNLFENIGIDKWAVEFKNNTFSYSNIDFNKVDLTNSNNNSSLNTIGNDVVECLVIYPDRASATTALGKNKAFINTNGGNPLTSTWFRDITL